MDRYNDKHQPIPYIDKLDTQRKGIEGEYVKPIINPKQMLALKTFMPFFKDKLKTIIKELQNATNDINLLQK